MTSSPISQPLFRAEALQAQTAQFLGGIRIAKPPSFTVVTLLALVMAAALIGFAAWGQATRKAQVSGVLMPAQGLLHLGSPQPARVAQVLVSEGDTVTEGQLLAVLQTGGASTKGDTATLIAKSLAERRLGLESEKRVTTAQAQQRHNALADRLRSLPSSTLPERKSLISLERALESQTTAQVG